MHSDKEVGKGLSTNDFTDDYKICNHLDSSSKRVMNKLNEYDALSRPDYLEQFEDAKYKYLFKDKPVSESTIIQEEAEEIIKNINSYY